MSKPRNLMKFLLTLMQELMQTLKGVVKVIPIVERMK